MFEVTRDGAVAEVRFTRPPLNVLRLADWASLDNLIGELEADPAVAALVFHGGDARGFSAGNDFREFPDVTRQRLDHSTASIRDALRRLDESSLVSVAAVHGVCYGSAFLLACCCDVRVAAPDAVFGLPEMKVGAIGGYQIARSLLPAGEARRIVFASTPLPAGRAYELGLVQEIVDQPATRGRALAAAMTADIRPTHRGAARRMLLENDRAGMWDAHERERQHILDYMTDK